MELDHCRQHDFIHADALALRNNLPDNQKGNAKSEVDVPLHCASDCDGYCGLHFVHGGSPIFGRTIKQDDISMRKVVFDIRMNLIYHGNRRMTVSFGETGG